MQNKNSLLVPVVLVASAIIGITAYVALRPHAPMGRKVKLISGIDTSGSEREKNANGASNMGRGIALLAKLGARLDSDRDDLTVFRVDRETLEFYDQLAPQSREKFQWRLINQTKDAAPKGGTIPWKYWDKAADRAALSKVPVIVCLFTNGDCDDLSEAAHLSMRQSAQKLADNPHVVAVYVFGAQAKNWNAVKDDFAILGERLHVQNPDEMDINPLLTELEAARLIKDETRLAEVSDAN